MELARRLASLVLKATKCHIVPLAGPFSPTLAAAVTNFLQTELPGWKDFAVVPQLLYLGMWLGPAAALEVSWDAPWAKYEKRVAQLAEGETPVSSTAILYKTRAVTVTSYVAQFLPVPDSMLQREIFALARICRFPVGALRLTDFLVLHLWGGPMLRSVKFAAMASLIRAAQATIPQYADVLRRMRNARASRQLSRDPARVSLQSVAELYPRWWQPRALAEYLEDAAEGMEVSRYYNASSMQLAAQAARCIPASARHRPQRQATAALAAQVNPDCLAEIFCRRLSKVWPERAAAIRDAPWEAARRYMMTLPISWSFAIIRTFSGAWLTSWRIAHPAGQRSCIFGCQGQKDSVGHYLEGPRMLWAV